MARVHGDSQELGFEPESRQRVSVPFSWLDRRLKPRGSSGAPRDPTVGRRLGPASSVAAVANRPRSRTLPFTRICISRRALAHGCHHRRAKGDANARAVASRGALDEVTATSCDQSRKGKSRPLALGRFL